MEIVKIRTNTNNADGIKLNREIRTAFEKYLKAKQKLEETVKVKEEEITYDKITVEQLYASWLATFENSEDYKTTMKRVADKDEAARTKRDNDKEENRKNKKAAKKAQYIAAGFTEEQAEQAAAIAVEPVKRKKKKAAEKATEQEEKN